MSLDGCKSKALVLKAIEGDQSSITELYYLTYPTVRTVAINIVKSEADADDIVQNSYIKAFSNLEQLREPEKFEAWLYKIVANKCKDYLRKKKPLLFSSHDEDDDTSMEEIIEDETQDYNPEDVLLSSDTRKQIYDLLESLPDEQRICLIYYAVNGMKISEIADLLDVPEATVKSRLKYAKSKMQIKINDLEKKGVKIRGVSGIALLPLLRFLFTTEQVRIPPMSGNIAGSISSAAKVSQTSKSVGAVTEKAAKGTFAKFVGSTAFKIVAGVLAATTVTASVVATIEKLKENTPDINFTTLSQSTDDTSSSGESTNSADDTTISEWSELNRMLSYVAEQRLTQYPCSDSDLYWLAYGYNKMHTKNIFEKETDLFEYTNLAQCVKKEDMDSVTEKLFNKKIEGYSDEHVYLIDGVYYNEPSDGFSLPYAAVVRQLTKNDDNTYKAIFDIYNIADSFESPVSEYYYSYTSDDAKSDSSMVRVIGGYAILGLKPDGKYYIKEYKESEDVKPEKSDAIYTDIIPASGIYYVGKKDIFLYEGERFPTPGSGDYYMDENYEYRLGMYIGPDDKNSYSFGNEWEKWQHDSMKSGWGVKVIDRTKTEYPDIPNFIAGLPVDNLDCVFAMCKNLKKAPQISSKARSMAYAFYGCENLEKAEIIIPSGVTNLDTAFMWCAKLTGEIEIQANPTEYSLCFYRTAGPIVLCGKEKLPVYDEIIKTAPEGVVSWKTK